MSEKEELRKQINRLHNRLWVLESAERRKENDKLVGKIFRYRNSYSGGKPQWWVYYKVVKGSDGSYVKAFRFDIDPLAHCATIGIEEVAVTLLTKRCTEETFLKAWKETIAWVARCAENAKVG